MEQRLQKYLPQMAKGEMITAIGMTEPNWEWFESTKNTAEDKGDHHYIVNGQKTFITNGFMCDMAIVAVKQMSIQIRKELLYLLWNHRWRVSVKEFL
jgi:acyl-CoA dehydrogenase